MPSESTADWSSNLTASVVICAYSLDRWNDLCAAVESCFEQSVEPLDVIVVVDHNEDLLHKAAAEFPAATVIPNVGEKGLSGGRSTGAQYTTADVLVFLDDDAVADSNFVAAHLAAYADPNVLGVGGRILPNWREGEPDWFPREFLWVVGCTYKGMPEKATPIRNPIGANMSMLATVFAESTGFEPKFGRTAANGRVGGTAEETEFAIRAAAAAEGGHWQYEPSALVEHLVTRERSTWRYFLDRCKLEGAAKALLSDVAGSDSALASERRYSTVTLPKGVLCGFVDCIRGDFSGIKRSGAILVGLGVTALSYARTLARVRSGASSSATIGDDRA